MKREDITRAMLGASVTGGWDAISAMDTTATNAVLFQQFANADPGSPARILQIPVLDGTDIWLLDLVLGHPEISFQPTGATVEMLLIGGSLTCVEESGTVTSILRVLPNTSWLQGPLNLKAVYGTTKATGQVIAELGAGAWSPALAGVDPASALATEIGTAITAFFADNNTSYELNALGPSSAPLPLTPTYFDFDVLANPSVSGDGCVLLLIQTTGTGGPAHPFATYPIPAGSTTALVVSNEVLFSGLIAPSLGAQLKNTGTIVAGEQSSGVWGVATQGGAFNFGVICTPNPNPHPSSGPPTEYNGVAYPTSCDSNGDPAAVSTSASGITGQPSGGAIALTWTVTWDQNWNWISYVDRVGWQPNGDGESVGMQATMDQTFSAAVGANNQIVFSGSPSVTVSQPDKPNWFEKYVLGEFDANGVTTSAAKSVFSQFFSQLALPDVSTFALTNLLFPAGQNLSLKSASVPCDLYSVGVLQAPMAVSPPYQILAPGASNTLTAMDANGNPMTATWEVINGPGSVSSAGVYTASGAGAFAELAVIAAINPANQQQSGAAVVLVATVPPATGVIVSPPLLTLTAAQQYLLEVTDGAGTAIAATWSTPPAGSIAEGFSTGQYVYTAPSSVTDPQTFSLTATGSSGATGTVSISLAPTTTITLSADPTVQAGSTLAITASSPDLTELAWYVYPVGSGSVAPSQSQLGATYTPPASVATPTAVTIIATGFDGVAGAALLHVTVNPAS